MQEKWTLAVNQKRSADQELVAARKALDKASVDDKEVSQLQERRDSVSEDLKLVEIQRGQLAMDLKYARNHFLNHLDVQPECSQECGGAHKLNVLHQKEDSLDQSFVRLLDEMKQVVIALVIALVIRLHPDIR